jgi:hypothetical protein
MSRENALQLAATAWCGEKTKHKVMDPELAMEFAKILQREVNLRLLRLKHNNAWSNRTKTPSEKNS